MKTLSIKASLSSFYFLSFCFRFFFLLLRFASSDPSSDPFSAPLSASSSFSSSSFSSHPSFFPFLLLPLLLSSSFSSSSILLLHLFLLPLLLLPFFLPLFLSAGLGIGLDNLILHSGFALGFYFGTKFALEADHFGDEKFLRVFFGVMSGAIAVGQALPRIAEINACRTTAFKVGWDGHMQWNCNCAFKENG